MNGRERGTWIETLLPIIIVLAIFTFVLIWHMGAALAVLVVGIAIIVARWIQRREPREPGE